MVAIIEKRDLRDFDWLTTFLAVAIAGFGIWQIHNALPTESYWTKQIIGLGIALVAFIVISFSDYRRIIELAPIFYGFGPGAALSCTHAARRRGQRTAGVVEASGRRTISAIGICKDPDRF
jgi:cell division protein FtsW (lipid II flippase)